MRFKEKGFSIIEMLVTIAIISLLLGIMAGVSRDTGDQYALERSAQIVTQAINTARSSSQGNKLHATGGAIPTPSPGGYAVRFVDGASDVFIFADCDQSGTYTTSGSVVATCADAAGSPGRWYNSEFVQSFLFEPNITITRIQRCAGAGGPYAVTFIPPDPIVNFSPGASDGGFTPACSEHYVELEDTKGNSIRIYINKIGITRIE